MELQFVILGLGILFAATGFLLTENNARYLLAGYNTKPKEKQEKFDLKHYVPFFRRFHLILGITFIVFGLAIHTLNKEVYTVTFLVMYPLLLYIYLIIRGNTFWKD